MWGFGPLFLSISYALPSFLSHILNVLLPSYSGLLLLLPNYVTWWIKVFLSLDGNLWVHSYWCPMVRSSLSYGRGSDILEAFFLDVYISLPLKAGPRSPRSECNDSPTGPEGISTQRHHVLWIRVVYLITVQREVVGLRKSMDSWHWWVARMEAKCVEEGCSNSCI